MKQTAVELLINYIETQNKNGYEFHPKYNEEIINQSKELEKQQKDDYAIDFVCWLMDNCKLISTPEEENVLWNYDSEDYTIDRLLEIFVEEQYNE